MLKLPYYVAGAGASLLSSFLDLINDPTNGTVVRAGSAMRRALFSGSTHFLLLRA
jgi:hypothetical protein